MQNMSFEHAEHVKSTCRTCKKYMQNMYFEHTEHVEGTC